MMYWLLLGPLLLLSFLFGEDVAIILFVLSGFGLAVWIWRSGKKRIEGIQEKYDSTTAQRILGGDYWIGQTREQLRDALGVPERIETQRTPTKSKEIWKFFYRNSSRIRLKITMTDGVVSQIDER